MRSTTLEGSTEDPLGPLGKLAARSSQTAPAGNERSGQIADAPVKEMGCDGLTERQTA